LNEQLGEFLGDIIGGLEEQLAQQCQHFVLQSSQIVSTDEQFLEVIQRYPPQVLPVILAQSHEELGDEIEQLPAVFFGQKFYRGRRKLICRTGKASPESRVIEEIN
jgi:hypothetical protein